MPQMGESVTEGTILEWHVSEGQEVAEGDTVVEVSTDKIDAEVPAPASGVVTKILAQPDDTVEVGQVLAQIDPNGAASGNGGDPSPLKEAEGELVMGGGEGDEDLGDDSVASTSPQPGEIEVTEHQTRLTAPEAKRRDRDRWAMPEMGESVTEGDGARVARRRGRQQVAEGDTVVEVSTDKIDAEVPAPASGHDHQASGRARRHGPGRPGAGRDDGRRRPRRRHRATAASRPADAPPSPPTPTDAGNGRASPVARRIAAAKGVDIGALKGSGPGGKVTKEDVLAAADGGNGAAPAGDRRGGRGQAAARPRGDARPGDEREPLDADRDLVPHPRRSTSSTPSARRSTRR